MHPIVREALKLAGLDGGVEITTIADIPQARSWLIKLVHRRTAERVVYLQHEHKEQKPLHNKQHTLKSI